jgi:putative Mn2+ efflux pump MntP
MRKNIGAISNYLAGLILMTMGLIYLFNNSFMPYHRDAVSMQWSELRTHTHLWIPFSL